MEEKRCDVDLCRTNGEMFARRIDLIDLIQECCPPNSATTWFLKALTRPGEIEDEKANITFVHGDTEAIVRCMKTEFGTYYHLNDFIELARDLRGSLHERSEKAPENLKEKMSNQVGETFDLIDELIGELAAGLQDYFGD